MNAATRYSPEALVKMTAPRAKGRFVSSEPPPDKYARRRERCREEGRCPHCGQPCAPYLECETRRNAKNARRRVLPLPSALPIIIHQVIAVASPFFSKAKTLAGDPPTTINEKRRELFYTGRRYALVLAADFGVTDEAIGHWFRATSEERLAARAWVEDRQNRRDQLEQLLAALRLRQLFDDGFDGTIGERAAQWEEDRARTAQERKARAIENTWRQRSFIARRIELRRAREEARQLRATLLRSNRALERLRKFIRAHQVRGDWVARFALGLGAAARLHLNAIRRSPARLARQLALVALAEKRAARWLRCLTRSIGSAARCGHWAASFARSLAVAVRYMRMRSILFARFADRLSSVARWWIRGASCWPARFARALATVARLQLRVAWPARFARALGAVERHHRAIARVTAAENRARRELQFASEDRQLGIARGFAVPIISCGSGRGDPYSSRITPTSASIAKGGDKWKAWEASGAGRSRSSDVQWNLARLSTSSPESYVDARLRLQRGISWLPDDERTAIEAWGASLEHDSLTFDRATARLEVYMSTGSMPVEAPVIVVDDDAGREIAPDEGDELERRVELTGVRQQRDRTASRGESRGDYLVTWVDDIAPRTPPSTPKAAGWTLEEARFIARGSTGKRTRAVPAGPQPLPEPAHREPSADLDESQWRRESSLHHEERITNTPTNLKRKRGVNAKSRTPSNPGSKKARRVRQRRRR